VAKANLILQALSPANHAEAIIKLLGLDPVAWVLASVAYLREEGLAAVEDSIRPLADRTNVYVGIRNDLTSIQAIKRLLGLGVTVYAVDTATKQSIYHPKLYAVANDERSAVIIGSANLTFGGMYNNIEISTLIELDLTDEDDARYVKSISTTLDALRGNHPDHVFQIRDAVHADEIFSEGRLADETIIPPPRTGSTIKKDSRDALRPMKLSLRTKPKPKIVPRLPPHGGVVVITPTSAGPAVSHLVWQSKPLTERDLNIPKAAGTNPTGSMGWKKGVFDNIDQRHYFRDEVFKDITWKADAPPSKHERAWADFELIIKGVNYGTFKLKLTHSTDTKSKSYLQNNFMTQVHWGDTKEHVAKNDLLGRTLNLYRKDTNPPEFVIEID
jgi:hypothetical protein